MLKAKPCWQQGHLCCPPSLSCGDHCALRGGTETQSSSTGPVIDQKMLEKQVDEAQAALLAAGGVGREPCAGTTKLGNPWQ